MTTGAPSVNKQLAAMRKLFDWVITGQIVPTNPAGAVRGPQARRQVGAAPGPHPRKAGDVDLRKQLRARDGLSAGGDWIRTSSTRAR
jgi:site-specific recombinase XerC